MEYISKTGGCLCGAVKYKILAEPYTVYACHCTDCQTSIGSSFTLAMNLPTNGLEILCGEPRVFVRQRADGRKKNIFRCPECLTTLWGVRIQGAEYINIYAGTLDDTSFLKPVAHLWFRSAQPWILKPKDVLVYEKQPSDMEPINRAWQNRNT